MFKLFITFSILCSFPFASPVPAEKNRLLAQNKALLRVLKALRSLQEMQVGSYIENVEERVKKIIVEQLGVTEAEVRNEASFVDDLGADSLDTVELVMALEEEFEMEIPDEDAEKITTVQAAIDYVKSWSAKKDSEVSVGITKSELVEKLCAEQTHLSAKEVETAVEEILEHMASTLEGGDRIEIRGFGTFVLHYREPRVGRNPKTGDKVELKGKYVPHFKPGKELRERVNIGNQETAVGTLTKAELSEDLFDKLGFSKRDAKETVEVFFEEIRKALESGEHVKLSGFGNFDLRDKNERPGRNPKTGEDIPITERRVVIFHPGQKLKARVAHIKPE